MFNGLALEAELLVSTPAVCPDSPAECVEQYRNYCLVQVHAGCKELGARSPMQLDASWALCAPVLAQEESTLVAGKLIHIYGLFAACKHIGHALSMAGKFGAFEVPPSSSGSWSASMPLSMKVFKLAFLLLPIMWILA